MSTFTKKDLGLLLPDITPGDPISLRHTTTKEKTETHEPLKPKFDPSKKVERYRAGQVPHFATSYDDDRGFVTANSKVRSREVKNASKSSINLQSSLKQPRKKFTAQVITAQSPNKEGVPPSSSDNSSGDEGQFKKVVKAFKESSDSSSEDDSEREQRRQRLRAKILSKESNTNNNKVSNSPVEHQIHDSNSHKANIDQSKYKSSEESETDSNNSSSSGAEEESEDENVFLKPVFVPKHARATIKPQEVIEAEEELAGQKEEQKKLERKQTAKALVAEALQEEIGKEMTGDTTDNENIPDDTDGLDPEKEYRDWELRELKRIKRDQDLKETREKELLETQRRRNLTPEERAKEDEKLRKNEPKQKSKWKFMQKYYHKGAFYVDDSSVKEKDDVRKRETSEATLEDQFNREAMPKVMQVKNFGKSGRTKYTHLADQDTSKKDSFWFRKDEIREKYKSKLSGLRDIDQSMNKRRKKE